MSKSLFTVRGKKHAKHPQVIVKANKTKFGSLTLTHSKGKRKTRNKKLLKNPNPYDNKESYVSKRVIEDFKFNFSKAFKNYSISKEDAEALIDMIKRKQK